MLKLFEYAKGKVLEYGDYGNKNAVPLLFFHGIIGSAKQDKMGEYLADRGIRLISIARSGYGQSTGYVMENYLESAAIIQSLLEQLDINSCDLLAVSAGAPHAYGLAVLSKKIRRIYVYSGLAYIKDSRVMAACAGTLSSFYDFVNHSDIETVGGFLRDQFLPQLDEKILQSEDLQQSLLQGNFAFGHEATLQAKDWGFELDKLKVPIIMQHAAQDEIVPVEAAIRTVDILSKAELFIMESGSHYDKSNFFEILEMIAANRDKA